MMSLERGERAHRSGERGAIAILSALLLTVFMGFGAMAFDLAYVRLARLEMKNATDAATHTAMFVLRTTRNSTTATTAAEIIAGKNTVLGHAVVLTDADITFGQWDWDASTFTVATPVNAVQIYAHGADPTWTDGTVKTTFGNILGQTSANIAQSGNGAYRPRVMMFEMDVTGSFLTASCAIDDAIDADVKFLDAMYNAGSLKDKIGLDVFVGSASPFTPLQDLLPNYASIHADWFGDGISALKMAHTTGLGVCTQAGLRANQDWTCGGVAGWPNQADLKPGVPMPSCWAGDSHYAPPTSTVNVFGGTNIGAGIKSGIDALDAIAKSYQILSIVLFTDGGPLCCEAATGGALCPQAGPCCADGTSGGCADHGTGACACSAAVKKYGTDMADLAATKGYDVYVLAFGGYAPWVNYAHTLPRGRGFALDTNNKALLVAKLQQIANAIPISLVR